ADLLRQNGAGGPLLQVADGTLPYASLPCLHRLEQQGRRLDRIQQKHFNPGARLFLKVKPRRNYPGVVEKKERIRWQLCGKGIKDSVRDVSSAIDKQLRLVALRQRIFGNLIFG